MEDLQKAAYSKRIFAFLADLILAGILITAIYLLMSTILRVDKYTEKYNEIKSSYEQTYGVKFGITQDEFESMSEYEKDNYRSAVVAMNSDEEANRAVRTSYTLSFVILSSGIILAMIILEFVIPLIFKDGRTLGKLLFGLGVMRRSHLKLGAVALFARNVIGKGVLEITLPILIILTIGSGATGIFGIVLLVIAAIAEIVVFIKSKTGALLHDILADTVVIDWASQRIFNDINERDAFEKARRESAEERKLY